MDLAEMSCLFQRDGYDRRSLEQQGALTVQPVFRIAGGLGPAFRLFEV